MAKRLKDFMKMCGPWQVARVIIWDPESVKHDYPLFKGYLDKIPYWLAIRKVVSYDPYDDNNFRGISIRKDLGDGNQLGFEIMLESQEKEKKGKKKK